MYLPDNSIPEQLRSYSQLYTFLRKQYKPSAAIIDLQELNTKITHREFISEANNLLPGKEHYSCSKHVIEFSESLEYRETNLFQQYPDCLAIPDDQIVENKRCNYLLVESTLPEARNDVILFLHGLNEKTWDKYLPWAYKLAALTGKKVLLFPIAFHMSRVPAAWSDRRLMNEVAAIRKRNSEAIEHATFANAAISARIQARPQRFFWSGLQTFYDLLQIVRNIREGQVPGINSSAAIDFFSYSVGSFLSEILLMANTDNLFEKSKLFMFCGGPTLDRMHPNSKFILDSDATIALYSYFTERLDAELKLDPRIQHYFTSAHPAGLYFKSMLNYHKGRSVREKRFTEMADRLQAISLVNDEVIPSYEVSNTLQGINRSILVQNTIMDFTFPYDHITPFPCDTHYEPEVTEAFTTVFTKAAQFLY